jgi:cAMP phosphodiesterase
MFVTTIKNVIGREKKLKVLIGFHSAKTIDNYNREGNKKKKKKKSKKFYRTSQKIRIMFFLSHCYQSPFPRWEAWSTLPP